MFNGEQSILQLHAALTRIDIQHLLVIDDGSLDATAQILNDNGIPHLSHETNLGKGAAIRSGAKWAIENNFHWILTLDADQQHPPSSIPVFIERMKAKVKFDTCPKIKGAMVVIKWQTKDLLAI